MTVGELQNQLQQLPKHLEIVVRTQWEEDTPNGNCFNLTAAIEDFDHGTGEPFCALEADQEFDAADQPHA